MPRNASPVEPTTMAAVPFAGQRRPGPLRIVRPINQPAEAHRRMPDSGVAAGHGPVEVRMDMFCPAVAQEPVPRCAAATGQRLGPEPSIGRE